MDVECDQSIVEDFKQIRSILALLSTVSLYILKYIAETESFAMPAVEDEVRRLVFALRVVLVVC